MTNFFGLISLLLLSFGGYGQQYNFINYSIEDGLAQSQVKSMCQDQEGYIWLGTLGGLSKWDGVNFQNFSINEGLLDNGIYSLLTAKDGKVFIGTKGGVNVYQHGKISTYKFKNELKEQYVRAIVEDNNRDVWFGLDNGWLIKFSKDKLVYIDIKKRTVG